MIFTISRASDKFMTIDHPTPEWSPHPEARWHLHCQDWLIEIDSTLELVDLITGTGAKLVISQSGDGIPHVEIDDVSE